MRSLVRVPSPAEESFRDLVRAREDARGDLMRHRHRLSKFVLRREIRPPAGTLAAWSVPWMNWVPRLRLEDAPAQATHVDYLAAVEATLQRGSALDLALEETWPQSPFQTTIARLRCFRGIDTLSGCGVAAELGGFDRFEHPDRLTGFLGSSRAKTELIADRVWRTRSQLELAVVEYVGWLHFDRLHEALGDRPPAEFETLYAAQDMAMTTSIKIKKAN